MKSPGKSRTGKRQKMMAPVAALVHLASRKRAIGLYVQEKKVDARYGFRIGELKFLLRPQEKVEVIEAVPVCPIPNTPHWFTGMINLRGNLLPVFSIDQLLDLKKNEPSRWIIIFGQGSRAAGIYTDSPPAGVIPDRAADAHPPLPGFLQDYVENTLLQGNNIWIEVAFEKLFSNLRAIF